MLKMALSVLVFSLFTLPSQSSGQEVNCKDEKQSEQRQTCWHKNIKFDCMLLESPSEQSACEVDHIISSTSCDNTWCGTSAGVDNRAPQDMSSPLSGEVFG
jgi:hypothetical protein